MAEPDTQFVLVPRSASGRISRPGQNLIKQHMRGGKLAFDRDGPDEQGALPPKVRKILEEFRRKLPKGIRLDTNPFLVLKIAPRSSGLGLSRCECKCSLTSACGGGGGGGGSAL